MKPLDSRESSLSVRLSSRERSVTNCGKLDSEVLLFLRYNRQKTGFLLGGSYTCLYLHMRSDNKVRELATVCLLWQQWAETVASIIV
jgi:hypothetical protein